MKRVYASLLFTLLIIGCSKKDEIVPNQTVKLNNPINNFTWKAMNSWYNWQNNVPNLADTKDDNQNEYYNYLNSFSESEDLFKSLIYQEGTVDRFSWFIQDYEEQQKQFQGISKSFGIKTESVAIDETNVIIYIIHVSKNSPAANAGIKRGDIINTIDGTVVTKSNHNNIIRKLYGAAETVEISLTEKDGKTFKEKNSITLAEVKDNPVYLTKVFNDIGGKKVGYLVYNGFISSYNDELNIALGKLRNAGIQELILDFRINGGGSVETCSYLASMIHKEANTGKFAELRFNRKHLRQSSTYSFSNKQYVYSSEGKKIREEPINRIVGLSKIYVITSKRTASASEMIINGLRPYIEVKTVGTTTYGKNVGSITLYDSPKSGYIHPKYLKDSYPQKQNVINEFNNKPHKNAMQPITFQIYNKLEQSDYTQGFNPTIEVKEFMFWNNILPFGDENEIVLKAALNDIRGITAKPYHDISNTSKLIPEGDLSENKFDKEMYIDGSFLEKQLE